MNLLLLTDVYKMGHMSFYPKGTEYVYSYMTCRSSKKYDQAVFYGLQYYLNKYLSQPITKDNAREFLEYRKSILGSNPQDIIEKINSLADLGYLPLSIKAIPEGTVIANQNILFSITNTDPKFYWVVGFVESILLKVWNPMTVATYSRQLKSILQTFAKETCDDMEHLPFQIHDFGYRGCSSEETSALSGSAHLLNFLGTDTVPAVKLLKEYYAALDPVGLSVPATEHSVMCAFTRDKEIEAFQNVIDTVKSGIVSIVSDSYNLWDALEYDLNIPPALKVVFRPDSGDPVKIICGDIGAEDPRAQKGALEVLAEKYGTTLNKQGYKVLNPSVGLIYGDGITKDRMQQILLGLKEKGFASSNVVFGIGGLLLQQHTRDDLGVSIKATWVKINGTGIDIEKDPITDHSKKSHKGRMVLLRAGNTYTTVDEVSASEERGGVLTEVFRNGKLMSQTTLEQIRARISDVDDF